MCFLVDECTGPSVARYLREIGHTVFSVYEQARGLKDADNKITVLKTLLAQYQDKPGRVGKRLYRLPTRNEYRRHSDAGYGIVHNLIICYETYSPIIPI